MKILFVAPVLLLGIQTFALADTILPGTEIQVRSDRPLDISRWDKGRIYPAHVARDVFARDGDVAIPRGATAEMIVRQTGPDQFTLDLESITVNGKRYVMDTAGPQYNMPRDAQDNGSGLIGSIVGAIAGASGQNVETRGSEIRVPADSVLRFELREPLHTVGWGDPGYNNNRNREDEDHYHRDHDWYR